MVCGIHHEYGLLHGSDQTGKVREKSESGGERAGQFLRSRDFLRRSDRADRERAVNEHEEFFEMKTTFCSDPTDRIERETRERGADSSNDRLRDLGSAFLSHH